LHEKNTASGDGAGTPRYDPSLDVADDRFDRYRRLAQRLDKQSALDLIDRLQVLALAHPETLREIEDFLDRGEGATPPVPLPARQPSAADR
jgi:hypothetical protein